MAAGIVAVTQSVQVYVISHNTHKKSLTDSHSSKMDIAVFLFNSISSIYPSRWSAKGEEDVI